MEKCSREKKSIWFFGGWIKICTTLIWLQWISVWISFSTFKEASPEAYWKSSQPFWTALLICIQITASEVLTENLLYHLSSLKALRRCQVAVTSLVCCQIKTYICSVFTKCYLMPWRLDSTIKPILYLLLLC